MNSRDAALGFNDAQSTEVCSGYGSYRIMLTLFLISCTIRGNRVGLTQYLSDELREMACMYSHVGC